MRGQRGDIKEAAAGTRVYYVKTDEIKSDLEQLRILNCKEEAKERKKLQLIEGEVENWISKYEKDMGEMNSEVGRLAVCSYLI
jgi:hypothetical protein